MGDLYAFLLLLSAGFGYYTVRYVETEDRAFSLLIYSCFLFLLLIVAVLLQFAKSCATGS